jgi:phosphate transport system protein
MQRHLDECLQNISEMVVRLGGMAERAIGLGTKALMTRDSELAVQVIEGDARVDQLELEIDDACIEIMARQQPMARDLRFLAMAMKITPDLERIADLGANMSRRATELNDEPRLETFVDFPLMAERAQLMLRQSLDAFVKGDADLARETIALDQDLDRWMEHNFRVLVTLMLEDPTIITRALRLLIVSKNLERIGDQVTNICEMIVYMVEGKVIKHGRQRGASGGEAEA